MTVLTSTAIALFAGLMMTRIFKYLRFDFPDVTAFLVAGLLVGPFALGRLGIPGIGFPSFADVESMAPLTDAALGFIAFSIGAEFKLSELKDIGRPAIVIGIFQSVFASICVDIALILLHFFLGSEILPFSVCITLGAIASATAPAATMMVVRQYKAKGPVTSLLLPIVALDDAVGLVVFAVSFGIAQALEGGELNVVSVGIDPLIEIVASVVLGALFGVILARIEKLFYSNSNRLSVTISFVLLAIAISGQTFGIGPVTVSFSSLLVCMMLGTVFCNLSEFSADIFQRADKWTAPLYAAFFVLSGADLDISVFTNPSYVIIGIVYILVRCFGKYTGARFSSKAMGTGETVVRYLGITLFPQAGVALGMMQTASTLGDYEGSVIRNVVLFGVLIYELVGPSLTKMSLTRAGEIRPASVDKKSRDRFRR